MVCFGAAYYYFRGRGQAFVPDYRTLFILGIAWIPIGISSGNYLFVIVGIILMVASGVNKDKWKEIPGWSAMPLGEKIIKIFVISILLGLVIAGILVYFAQVKEGGDDIIVIDYETCVAAGHPIMESYPEQCRSKEGDTYTRYIGNELELSDLIMVDSPRPGAQIESPLVVKGQALGTWFFEGDFPILLTNWDGLIIAEGYATVQGDWMTEEFVPYEGILEFIVPEVYDRGVLILKKDNPSALPEFDRALEIPIVFNPVE